MSASAAGTNERDMYQMQARIRTLQSKLQLKLKSIVDLGLPPLNQAKSALGFRISTSQAEVCEGHRATTSKHEPLSNKGFKVCDFGIISPLNTQQIASNIWTSFDSQNIKLKWSSEASIQRYVHSVIQDCIAAANLEEELEIENEVPLFVTDDAGVLVIRSLTRDQGRMQRPIAMGVVKCQLPTMKTAASSSQPDSEAISAPTHSRHLNVDLPQLYDEMRRLRDEYCVRDVFGIVTNYLSWRIVWFPDTDEITQSRNEQPGIHKFADEELIEVPETRVLHGTNLISWEDKDLIPTLISVLRKMYQMPNLKPKPLLDLNRCYFEFRESCTRRVRLTVDEVSIEVLEYPCESKSVFRLNQDYGQGRDGRVWLAATAASHDAIDMSKLAVIKVPRIDASLVDFELAVWQTVLSGMKLPQGLVCKLSLFGDQSALLMPFTFHVRYEGNKPYFSYPDHRAEPSESPSYLRDVNPQQLRQVVDEANQNVTKVAYEAIATIAEAGYEHLDVRLRHVAFLVQKVPGSGGSCTNSLRRRPLLIDFADMRKIEHQDEAAKNEAIDRMKQNLDKADP